MPLERVRKLLKENDITQAEIAHACGMDQSHFSKMLSGEKRIYLDRLIQITVYLRKKGVLPTAPGLQGNPTACSGHGCLVSLLLDDDDEHYLCQYICAATPEEKKRLLNYFEQQSLMRPPP